MEGMHSLVLHSMGQVWPYWNQWVVLWKNQGMCKEVHLYGKRITQWTPSAGT